ncbi:MAG: carbohydrate binding family 9 domain-containing protein [Acidobacteria bacterium]|nr:carbohydrate binding family 9 domain-containing protein [Acidobacteriota bacterium]
MPHFEPAVWRRSLPLRSLILASWLWPVPGAFAQAHQHTMTGDSPRDRYAITATRVDQMPKIDGVLDEDVWRQAKVVDAFTQQEPREGAPATERTEVRVLYDGRTLIVGVHAFDRHPSAIVATEMRRDSDRLLDEDNFQLILDTFNDSRNGYMFVTTPLGAKLEQQISDEGEGNNRAGLINTNINKNWDGVWDVAARITDDGWVAEIAIPLTTLRFPEGTDQTWGINFERNIRRTNEQVFWAPIPKAYTLTRVSMAGSLTGLRSLSHGLDLKLKPYVVSGVRANHTSPGLESPSFLRDVGLDAKYGVTGGLNLDVTYNTDFAQVEVDEQQVNLTRFSLFFPEKRDFFLENAGLFKMGTGGTFTSSTVETDLFFSRRIGLSDTGTPIPIIGGARLAGKSGRHNVAVLDIQTDSAFGKAGNNFLVGRYSSDVLKRSRVGAIVVDKETTGGDPHFNRTIAADANLVLWSSLQINSFVAKTSTPGLDGKDLAWFGRIAYRDPSWNLWLNYEDVQDNFNAEVGFVQRRGIRATKAYFSPTPRPGRAHIRMLEPMAVLTYVTDQQNRMVGRTQHFMNGFYMQDGSFLNVIYQRNLDVLDAPFKLQNVTIPIGTYKFDELDLTYNTNPAKRFYERFTWQPMEFYGGTRQTVSAAVGVRASSHLSSELQFSRNDVTLPYGAFLTNLAILRVDYAISPRATIRSLTQYNSFTSEVTNSIRFNVIYRPGSDLYIVYNDLQQTGLPQSAFAPSDRQIVVKLNYLLAR